MMYIKAVACPADETLIAMIENDLPASRFAELEVHIDSCEQCRKVVAAAASSRELALGTPQTVGELDGIETSVDVALGERYVVEALLGRGGMGTVYLARDKTLGREVALKLHRAGSSKDRLHREAVAMAKLAHPNVVTVFEVGELEDRMYVAMEYVRGTTLRGWLQAEVRGWREVLAMLLEAGRGLIAAHDAGLVHRDFKPENVLVGDDGRPRVGDFGLARAGGVRDSRPRVAMHATLDTPMTQTGMLLGTPAYMAPEQLTGDEVDARCDQFAFSVVAWECLYGKRPFSGATLVTLQEAIVERRFELVDTKHDVPDRVRRVLERGLAGEPAERYASLPELIAALREAAAPRTKRRIALAAFGGVLAMASIAGGLAYAGAHSRDAACARQGDAAAALFGPVARARVSLALAATGAPFAATSFDHAASVLDRRADALAIRTVAACHASTDSLSPQRKACLDEHARLLGELVDQLAHADPMTASHAANAAWSLRDPAECDDPRILVAEPPVTAASDPELARRLAHVEAELAAGNVRAGRSDVETLVRDAHARGDRALELAAQLAIGELREQTDDPADVQPIYEQALALAEALGRDVDAASALTSLAHLAGVARHDYATAHRDLALARAKLERIGSNLALAAHVDVTEAQILSDENRLGDAERLMKRATERLEQTLGPDHPTFGAALGSYAQIQWFQRELPEALATSRRALAILTSALGEDHATTAGAHMTVAQVLIALNRFDEARLELQLADAGFVHAYGPDHPMRSAIYGNLGALEASSNHPEAAIAAYRNAQHALERTTGPQSPEVADAHADIARVLTMHGRHDEALAELDQTLAILDKLGPAGAPRLVPALVDYAGVQLDRKHPSLALAPAERAVALASQLPSDANAADLADARFALASALWDTGRDRARAKQLAREAKAGKPTPERMKSIDEWLASHP